MGLVLNGLVKLQEVESRLRAVKSKLTRCKRAVAVHENQIGILQNALESKKEDIQATKLQSGRLELDLKSRDEIIAKLRASLNAAKTNKEYAAVLTQLNTTRADSLKLEASVLESMKDIETEEAESRKIQSQIDEQKLVLERVHKEAGTLALRYEEEIQQIQQQWDQIAMTVPPEWLAIFGRVAETHDGEALAVIERQDGRMDAYTCGGCFMGITVESVNLLMTRDDIIRCPNCSRILVLSNQQGN